MKTSRASWWAFSPLILFLGLFIGTGLYFSWQGHAQAFYQISPTVAIFPAIMLALGRGKKSLKEKVDLFLEGTRDKNIILMCLIYLLAGAFGMTAKAIGAVDAAVKLTLSTIPAAFILPGLFLTAAGVSMAMGSSMGTIAALTPLGVKLAESTGFSLEIAIGSVVGGAMFGDNLSLVSDTTIAATQTQGCSLNSKFKANIGIAFWSVILTLIILSEVPVPGRPLTLGSSHLLPLIPYGLVLGLAFFEVHILLTLGFGIITAGFIGLLTIENFTLLSWGQEIYEGFKSMQEIMLLSMLIGGLSALTTAYGALDLLIEKIEKLLGLDPNQPHSQRKAEFGIGLIVSLKDICTANNTIAILLSGDLSKSLAQKYGVKASRSASLLDIFSCVFQGLLPYGAQVLLACSIAGLSPLSLIPHIYYCMILGLLAVGSIIFQTDFSGGFMRAKLANLFLRG